MSIANWQIKKQFKLVRKCLKFFPLENHIESMLLFQFCMVMNYLAA